MRRRSVERLGCSYDCAGPAAPVCQQNRCALAIDMPAAGDGGDASPGGEGDASAGGDVADASVGNGGDAVNVDGAGDVVGVGGGSPPRTAQLVVEPADGTTAQGGHDITLQLYDVTGVVDDAKLGEVGARAFLETWPERAPVAFTLGALAEPPTNYKVLRLVPAAPLEDRWYVAGVTALPSAITYWTALADGTVGNRFRTGSHPRVAQIQFCEKAAPGMKLLVAFSEPITLIRPAGDIVTLQIGGSPSPCEWYQTTAGSLYFTCAALTLDAKVIVSVGAGVQSATGAALPAASWNIDVGALAAGSCRSYATAI